MFQHNILHSLSNASLALGLIFTVIKSIIRQQRGEVGLVRQNLLFFSGLALMLSGSLMRGGPHDDAGTLTEFIGGLILMVTILRIRKLRKASKPAA